MTEHERQNLIQCVDFIIGVFKSLRETIEYADHDTVMKAVAVIQGAMSEIMTDIA